MEKKITDKIEKILPKYSWIPLILVVTVNLVTYFGTRLFTQNLEHHVLQSRLDEMIPFCPVFIVIYILAYVQWITGFIMIGRQDKNFCYKFLYGEIIAKLICMLCYIFYPTTIIRPEITGSGIFNELTLWIYQADAPDNLFPSIHCLESWVVFRASLGMKNMPKWNPYVMFIFTILVFASTVFVKQHVVVDMFGAMAAFEIGLFITKCFYKKRNSGLVYE